MYVLLWTCKDGAAFSSIVKRVVRETSPEFMSRKIEAIIRKATTHLNKFNHIFATIMLDYSKPAPDEYQTTRIRNFHVRSRIS